MSGKWGFENLMVSYPPPENPVGTGTLEMWMDFEGEVQISLPHDYKQFLTHYGDGVTFGCIRLFNPFSEDHYLNFRTALAITNSLYNDLLNNDPLSDELPYPIYPQPGGLLLFGSTTNGDWLFWKTIGNPDEWTIVIHLVRSDENEEHQLGFVQLLIELQQGNLKDSYISKIARPKPFEKE